MLGERLLSVAEFVRQDAVFADVGTDHAYLPVFLLSKGRISRAVCSDVNEGPLGNARATAREAGITENIEFVLTDGARALQNRGITDMAICGMGGELIAEIIEAAPYIKDDRVRLILQPMTRQEHLRRYLYESGFELIGEGYATEGGKSYLVLCAEYTGAREQKSELEIDFGLPVPKFSSRQRAYIRAKLASLMKKAGGLRIASGDATTVEREINYLESLLERLGEEKNDC